MQPLANHLVTAVIVHDSDWHIENTQLVIDTAARYPFVREILVWNNDIDLQIDGKVSKAETVASSEVQTAHLSFFLSAFYRP